MFLPLPLCCPSFLSFLLLLIMYPQSRSSWVIHWQVCHKPPFALRYFLHCSHTCWLWQELWSRESPFFLKTKVSNSLSWKFWRSLLSWGQKERSKNFTSLWKGVYDIATWDSNGCCSLTWRRTLSNMQVSFTELCLPHPVHLNSIL